VPGKVIFEAQNLGKKYGNHQVFDHVDFFVQRGDRIALLGQNGQGKTTLAKILAGEIKDYSGEWNLGHNVNIGYFAQNQEEVLSPEKTVLQEAEDAATEETRTKVRDLLGSFLFSGEDVTKKTKVLSGGERNRLALCKLLLRPFNTLIMDEPTNHLDIQSKEIIKLALQKFEGTIIVISHDREFLQGLCDKIFEFRDGSMKEFLGNINEYLEYRQKESLREISAEKSKLASIENNANNYILPVASATVLGGVKAGTNISIDANGVISANDTSVAWSEITSKPTFATVATSGSYVDLSNKPTIPTTLPASDVYAWAKASTKPSYTYSEITGTPTIPAAQVQYQPVVVGGQPGFSGLHLAYRAHFDWHVECRWRSARVTVGDEGCRRDPGD
jgi:ABC-type multidrug transport system ATPase subunit